MQISKDGDTLELSKPKISDAMLSGYSEARLKQLFNNKEYQDSSTIRQSAVKRTHN